MPEADEVITLPVPEEVSAIYVVATTLATMPDPRLMVLAAADKQWRGPLRSLVGDLLDAPNLPIEVRPIEDLPPPEMSLLAGMGATDEQLDRIAHASHAAVIATQGRPGWPPDHEWAARAMAVMVAEYVDGDVIDVINYHVMTSDRAKATLPDDDGRIRLSDWIWVHYSPDRHGYWCTTTGLRRFGLPELQTLTAPPNVVEQWGSAMTGIAHRLLEVWVRAIDEDRGAAFVELPAHLEVTGGDVATAYRRDTPDSGLVTSVRLALDPGTNPDHHSFLTIHPPLNWSGSAGEHIADVCATMFGPRTSAIRRARPSDHMNQAIATARAGLTEIRTRFESGQLDLHTKLLVKYALPAEEGTEYLWAYVTSWRDPYRILATSGGDGVYHPKVRTGRPVVVDTAAVVDWAVEHDELGIIEGYWTQAALDDGE